METAKELLDKALEKQQKQTAPELPEEVTDKVSLSRWLQESGLKRNTAQYDELYSRLSEGLPLEKNLR
jgi:hypothetical protein